MTSNIKTALQLTRDALWGILVSDGKGDSQLTDTLRAEAYQAHGLADDVLEDIGERDIPYPDDMPPAEDNE